LYGPDDELGTLNLLTDTCIIRAAAEITTGKRVGLNLPLDMPSPPSHNRMGFSHKIIHKQPRNVHDDIIEMNTQCSTQWDGFRHYGYQKENICYNGVTIPEISGPDAGLKLGLGLWCKKGIAGRGVLLDYLRYATGNNIEYELLDNHEISLAQLKACAEFQNTTFREGDILIIRSGWTKAYCALDEAGRTDWAMRTPPRLGGVATTKDMAEWLWDSGFSAVASDGVAFESLPFKPEGEPGGLERVSLHEVLLGGWGMPIGEMWNLEDLSEECARQGRYSFFLTSMPLNIPTGIAGPANVLAIF
jgi:kynurenine formamidase